VTTDTPEYCSALAQRIDHDQQINPQLTRHENTPVVNTADQVVILASEGRKMCEQGLVVGGIARLRRAWMLLHPPQ
jgi:hypothetical protein